MRNLKYPSRKLLLKTEHGSRLYGLAHADSDYDTYQVWEGKGKMQHHHSGDDDTVNKSFDQFMRECGNGVPQALEALWSPVKMVDEIDYMKIMPGYSETLNRYQRTMKSFWLDGGFKRRRHALRLQMNAREFMAEGRFNPRLTEEQAALVSKMANDPALLEDPEWYPKL